MASKKGIAITAAIVAGVVGASFLIWFLPQGNAGTNITPFSYQDILSEVYAQHNDLAYDIELEFDRWKNGELTSEEMLAQIKEAQDDAIDMRKQLADARPSPQWHESYTTYTKALDTFAQYLDAMKASVLAGDKNGSDADLDGLKQQFDDYVDESISAIPIPS